MIRDVLYFVFFIPPLLVFCVMSPLKFPVFTPVSPVFHMVCYFGFRFFYVLYFAFVGTFCPFLSIFLCLAPLVCTRSAYGKI